MSAHAPATEFDFTPSPGPDDTMALIDIITEANEAAGSGDAGYREFGFFIRDETGKTIGGTSGYLLFDWMFVQFLAVPTSLRGQGVGTALLHRAEQFAREHGAIGMWLDTFAFGAPDFYHKLGFSVFGTIEDHPPGSRRFFFQKRFEAPTA